MFIDTLDPEQEVETVVVCSGGGAMGWWQWCLLLLIASKYKIAMICGCSAGSINTWAFSKGFREQMRALYKEAFYNNARNVFKPGIASLKNGKLDMNWFKALPKIIFSMKKIKSLMTNEPLLESLRKLDESKAGREIEQVWWNAVNMRTGRLVNFEPGDFNDKENELKSVVASTTIPVLLPLVDKVETKSGTQVQLGDGGLREGAPLGLMWSKLDPRKRYRIIVLSCNNLSMAEREDLDNVMKVLGRVAMIFLNEGLDNDLGRTQDRNEEARRYGEELSGRTYAPIHVVEYTGKHGSFSFTPEAFDEMEITARLDFAKAFNQEI